jgi:peptide/nickel transport system substrate-binding protein
MRDSNDRWSLSRRAFLQLACVGAGGAAFSLLAACGRATAPNEPGQAAPAPTVHVLEQIGTPGANSAVAPGATSVSATRGEPKGRLVYAYSTTIPPAWLDPQENPPQVTPYLVAYAVHDAMVKPMPGNPLAPSLAESYEMAPDYKSATFKLRPGIKFHDGSPVTTEDVKFTFENYRGASAKVLHDKTDSVELVDDRTIRFHFKDPFLDFMVLYGSPASGAGWIVPKAYYQKVGPDGFKQTPIGAGPYRFVRQQLGVQIELEAFGEYWRKTPSVKTLVLKGVPEDSTRAAILQTGEADMTIIPSTLIDTIRRDPRYHFVPTRSAATWLECVPDRPDSPLADIRVRQAISLAVDRKALNDAEMAGMSPIGGNWIPEEYAGAISRPVPPFDLAKARQLLTEAGVASGFDVGNITPLPPYFSWAERVASQLRAVNIRTGVQQLERATFYEKLAPGPDRLKGFILQFSGAPGDAAARIRENAVCKGTFSGLCTDEVDSRMAKYDASTDPKERLRLLEEVQNYLLDNYIMLPVARNVILNAAGPRLVNTPTDVIGAIPQYPFTGPYEDIQLKD